MRIDVVTLFPELFPGPLAVGLVGRALREGRAEVGYVDPRRFTSDRHRSVDAPPYGGGAGMLMRPEPLAAAIEAVRARGAGPVVLLGPRGRRLAQADLERWSSGDHLGLVCGRYEGFDERVRGLVDDELSIGDFVLTGGEPAALVVIDGVIRLLPGTLGNAASASADSFSDGLLEHPQYTRPEVFRGQAVPEVLLGGHHERIEAWRRSERLRLTRDRRPDLLAETALDGPDRRALAGAPLGRRAWLALGLARPSPEAATRLARLAFAWGLEGGWLVGPGAPEALAAAPSCTLRGLPGPKRRDRAPELVLEPSSRLRAAEDGAGLASALGPEITIATLGDAPEPIRPAEARAAAKGSGLLIGIGLGAGALGEARALPPPRSASGSDVLEPLDQAAVLLERILGEG